MRSRRAEPMRSAVARPETRQRDRRRGEDEGHAPSRCGPARRGRRCRAGPAPRRRPSEQASAVLIGSLSDRQVERYEQEARRRWRAARRAARRPRRPRRAAARGAPDRRARPRAAPAGRRTLRPMAATTTSVTVTRSVAADPMGGHTRRAIVAGTPTATLQRITAGSDRPRLPVAAVSDQRARDGGGERRGDGDDRRHPDRGQQRAWRWPTRPCRTSRRGSRRGRR